MDVVIGIDTGTTATKGVAAGLDGELRALTSVHYTLSVPGPGRAELDPARLREAATEALVDVAKQCRERGDRVIAVCLSAFLHALVPMDPTAGRWARWSPGRTAGPARRATGSPPPGCPRSCRPAPVRRCTRCPR